MLLLLKYRRMKSKVQSTLKVQTHTETQMAHKTKFATLSTKFSNNCIALIFKLLINLQNDRK